MPSAYPAELDFTALFECEPALLDPGVPWSYNTAIYERDCGDAHVRFEIQPSYSAIKIAITLAGNEIAAADLRHVSAVEIITERSRELLKITNGEPPDHSEAYLTLKPAPRLAIVA